MCSTAQCTLYSKGVRTAGASFAQSGHDSSSGLHAEPGVPEGEGKVDEEGYPGDDGHHAHADAPARLGSVWKVDWINTVMYLFQWDRKSLELDYASLKMFLYNYNITLWETKLH